MLNALEANSENGKKVMLKTQQIFTFLSNNGQTWLIFGQQFFTVNLLAPNSKIAIFIAISTKYVK